MLKHKNQVTLSLKICFSRRVFLIFLLFIIHSNTTVVMLVGLHFQLSWIEMPRRHTSGCVLKTLPERINRDRPWMCWVLDWRRGKGGSWPSAATPFLCFFVYLLPAELFQLWAFPPSWLYPQLWSAGIPSLPKVFAVCLVTTEKSTPAL